MSVIAKIPSGDDSRGDGEYGVQEDTFQDEYPGIFEMIARIQYLGKARKPARLLIFLDDDKASLCLTDKATGKMCFYKSNTFAEALCGLERALQAGTVDWRKDRRQGR